MSLENYRVPDAVRNGIDITLPDSDAVFRVRLPSKHHKLFTRTMQSRMFAGSKIGPTGLVEMAHVDVSQLRVIRVESFLEHCVMMPLPEGMTKETLADEYAPALEALFDIAEAMAGEIDGEGEQAAKKSRRSSAGKSDG